MYVKLNGCIPVKSNFKSVDFPSQIAVVPLKVTEGKPFTDNTAVLDGNGQVLYVSFAIIRYCFPFKPVTSEINKVPVFVPEYTPELDKSLQEPALNTCQTTELAPE